MIYIKINPDEDLSMDEAAHIGQLAAEKGLTPDAVATDCLKRGIREAMAELDAKKPTRRKPAAK